MKTDYDVLIIGGGITGACVLWDATLRGMKSILVEKNDFASGTSQATSKLIHGGLRYLKNFELFLVRESLRERRYLAKITPHSVYPLGFAIPIYSIQEILVLPLGMELYNSLSWDRNYGIHPELNIPRYTFWGRKRCYYELPGIDKENLLGAFLYFDYANLNPERHTTEFIFSAKEKGSEAYNYREVVSLEYDKTHSIYKVGIKDKITSKSQFITTKAIVNATGPWADIVENHLGIPIEKNILRSKGIHIITRKICKENAVVLKKRDGTHLFIIPWRGKSIIGTTDTVFPNSPDDFTITRQEIVELIEEVNYAYPDSPSLTLEDVDFYYGGLRPLVEDSSSSYNASRKSEVIHHKDAGFPGFISALGGKYTTSRAIAKKVVDILAEYLPGEYPECITHKAPLQGGLFSTFNELEKQIQKTHPSVDSFRIHTLVHRYGSLAEEVLNYQDKQSDPKEFLLSGGEVFYPEEVRYIARNEAIVYGTDFFFRRSGVGVPGKPPEETIDGIFKILAKELGWNQQRVQNEKELVFKRYELPI